MVANKLLILHPNCPSKEELEAACQDDVTVVFYVPPPMYPEMERPESGSGTTNLPEATNLTELCKDATHVGLVWRNQGTQSIPFDGFEDMLHNGLTVDLITCNLGNEGFKERMQALEQAHTDVTIRYSLDKTANPEQGGDWIMESHGTSVKSLYFTDALNTYTQVLDVNNIVIMYDVNASKYVITSATNFTFVNNTVTITCSEVEFQGDINWPSQQYLLMDHASNNGMNVKISGLPGNKITITGSDYIGLIRNGAGGVVGVGGIISGLNVECATITGQGGGIIHKLANGGQQSHKLSIEDCTVTVTGSISAQRAGGICGTYAGSGSGDGNFAITRCSVTVGGSLSGQQSGGICGSHSQRCYITGCSVVVTGSISGDEAGGIGGSYAGYQGWCYITGCSVLVMGDISYGSGIGCAFGGYVGFCFVTGCSVKVVGDIGADAGAIYGKGVGIHNKPVGNSCYVDTTSTNVNFIGYTSWVPARDGATFSNCWISASTGGAIGGGVTNNITPSSVLTDINAAVLAYITNVLNTGSHNLGLVEISDMFELHNNGTANDPTDDYVMVKVEAVVDPAAAALLVRAEAVTDYINTLYGIGPADASLVQVEEAEALKVRAEAVTAYINTLYGIVPASASVVQVEAAEAFKVRAEAVTDYINTLYGIVPASASVVQVEAAEALKVRAEAVVAYLSGVAPENATEAQVITAEAAAAAAAAAADEGVNSNDISLTNANFSKTNLSATYNNNGSVATEPNSHTFNYGNPTAYLETQTSLNLSGAFCVYTQVDINPLSSNSTDLTQIYLQLVTSGDDVNKRRACGFVDDVAGVVNGVDVKNRITTITGSVSEKTSVGTYHVIETIAEDSINSCEFVICRTAGNVLFCLGKVPGNAQYSLLLVEENNTSVFTNIRLAHANFLHYPIVPAIWKKLEYSDTAFTTESFINSMFQSKNTEGGSLSNNFSAYDFVPPIINLPGGLPAEINQNAIYTISNETATDIIDGDVTASLVAQLNTTESGTKTITYTATDNMGNTGDATRTIEVLAIGGGGAGAAEAEAVTAGVDTDDIAIAKSITMATSSDSTVDLSAVTSITSESDIVIKRTKRHALLKLIFETNSTVDSFKTEAASLDLPTVFTKTNVKVFKSGQTINTATDTDAETGWYTPLENGESITVDPRSGTNFVISKASGQYTLSGTPTVTEVTSYTWNNGSGYFEDGDIATINGEPTFFGGSGGGGSSGGGSSSGDPFSFSLFVSSGDSPSILKTHTIVVSPEGNIQNHIDISGSLSIGDEYVPTTIVIEEDAKKLTFKNNVGDELFIYTYIPSTGGQSQSQLVTIIKDALPASPSSPFTIMSDPFILQYSIYSNYLFAPNPTFLAPNDTNSPPTMTISDINDIDPIFGTGSIEFKVQIEDVTITDASIILRSQTAGSLQHYTFVADDQTTSGVSGITIQYLPQLEYDVFEPYNTTNEINSLTISSLQVDIIYTDSVRQLSTVMSDGGNIILSVGGATIGDPFILPVYGDIYELPMKKTAFRMLQGYKLIMNASTRRITKCEGEQIKQYYEQTTQKNAPVQLITKGVFYDKVFLKSEGNVLEYDFNTGKEPVSSDYFTVTQCNKPYYSSITKILSNNRYIKVSFNHSKYGAIHIKLNHFTNPQIKYGFDFNVKRINDLTGLFIREYKYKSMMCRKLKNTKKCHGIIGKNKIQSVLRS